MAQNPLFNLKTAEQVRLSQTQQSLKQIKSFYEELYKETQNQLRKYGNKSIQQSQLILLQRDIKQRLNEINKQIQSGITDAMITTANAVVEDTREFLKRCGFTDVSEAFYYVPDSIVRAVLTGNVYQNGWTLSKAIWGHTNDFNNKLSTIIAKGTAQGKSAYEVALDLEKYVNPDVVKPSRRIPFINPRTGQKDVFYFGKVDYNAQRLARTLISHAYQQSFKMVNEKDPFVTEYVWRASGIHGRMCPICEERNGQHFKKNELPVDHPNGMCTYEAYIPYTMNEIADKIADWYSKPTGTYKDLDEYALSFLYE